MSKFRISGYDLKQSDTSSEVYQKSVEFLCHFAVTQENVTLLKVLIFERTSYVIYKENLLPDKNILDSFLKNTTLRITLIKVYFRKFEK